MAFDSKLQRQVFGRFATGVTVVTTDGSGGPHGLTANAVLSLSLAPPLVLVAVDKRAHSHKTIIDNQCFAVNILSRSQEALSRRFAEPGPKNFSGLICKPATTGAPILADVLAWVDCRLTQVLPGGDHDLFLGEIVAGEFHDGDPLLYFAGGYRQLQA